MKIRIKLNELPRRKLRGIKEPDFIASPLTFILSPRGNKYMVRTCYIGNRINRGHG